MDRCHNWRRSASCVTEPDVIIDSGSRVMGCDALVLEVLLRLPVRSVFKFRCVCRRWNSLISDPFFRKSFESREQCSLLPLLGFFQSEQFEVLRNKSTWPEPRGNCRMPFSSTSEEGRSIWRHNIINYLGSFIAGISEGLILCGFGPHVYIVYNPLTNQWSRLPEPNMQSVHLVFGFSCERIGDSGTINYKVVRADTNSWPPVPNTTSIEIFSSESGKWDASLLTAPADFTLSCFGGCDVVHGIFFWSCLDGSAAVYDSKREGNYLGLIRLPLSGALGKDRVFGPTPDGRIQCVAGDDFRLGVWILKNKLCDYRFSEIIPSTEWIARDMVSLRSLNLKNDRPRGHNFISRTFNRIPQIVALHPNNSDLVYLRLDEKIMCYNFTTRELQKVSYHGNLRASYIYQLFPYFQPLWPPTLPILP